MTRLGLIILLGLFAISCSKNEQSKTLVIDTAQFKTIAALSFPADKKRCWGVNVEADDIPKQPVNTCRPLLSRAKGFVEEGEPLEIFVRQGDKRKVQVVISLVDLTADCPRVSDLNDYSETYKIHEEIIDLKEEETIIQINPSYPGDGSDLASLLGLSSSCAGTVVPPVGDPDLDIDPTTVAVSPVVPVFPTNGSNWNDYIENDATPSIFSAGAICATATSNRPYNSCLHAGEAKKFTVSQFTHCDGLSAVDSLNAFEWSCGVQAGVVHFFTSSLAAGKGLKDLVEATTPDWKNNYITVTKSGMTGGTFVNTPAKWWSNTVSTLPPSPSTRISLATAGTVYVLDSLLVGYGYNITSDKVSIVTLPPNGVLQMHGSITGNCDTGSGASTGSQKCMVYASNRDHLWIEMAQDSASVTGTTLGFMLNTVGFSRLNGIFTTQFDRALHMKDAHSNYVSYMNANSELLGFQGNIYLDNSDYNTFFSIRSGRNYVGFRLENTSQKNSFVNIHVSDASQHGFLIDSADNTFVKVLSQHNNNNAFVTGASASGTTIAFSSALASKVNNGFNFAGANFSLHSSVAAGNADAGVYINNVVGARLSKLVSVNNTDGINLFGFGTYGSILGSGFILLGNNSRNHCNIATGEIDFSGTNFFDNDCFTFPGVNTSDASNDLATGNTFFGNIGAADPVNPVADATKLFSSIYDWASFANLFRGWVKDGTDAIASGDNCDSGFSCAVYDYRLKVTDTVLRDNSFSGVSGNGTLGNSICPAKLSGSLAGTKADLQTTQNTYLKHATEIMGDYVGDDDGLCESNEQCILAPNIGHYQGHGPIQPISCTFQNGAQVSNVTLFQHTSNGL